MKFGQLVEYNMRNTFVEKSNTKCAGETIPRFSSKKTKLSIGISPLTSFILALRIVLVTKLVISGILSSIFVIFALYTSFLTTLFFTASLSLLKSTILDINLSISYLSNLLFKLLKLFGRFFYWLKQPFHQKMMYQFLLHFFNMFLLHN